jgi:uncharacterized lipoprotein NlpE involved in copper resistance
MKNLALLGISTLVWTLVGCDNNPSKGKTQATTAEAVAVAAPATGGVKYAFSNADSKVEFVTTVPFNRFLAA